MLDHYIHFYRQMRAQYADPSAIRAMQDRKLRQLVHHAYHTVPYYRRLFDDEGVDPLSIRCVNDLVRVPISTKADLQAAGADAVTSTAFAPDSLTTEKTSGSSGRPFEIRFDPGWFAVRKAMFFRALLATGYRPPHKALFISSSDRPKSPPSLLRWHYMSYKLAPQAMLDELNRVRPYLLYGWVIPLRHMAEHALHTHQHIHQPRVIVTTAETLDPPTRQMLGKGLGGEVFEIYGLTEMGAMAWECPAHDGYHLAEDVVIAEYAATQSSADADRLLMTNLHLKGMPFLRYDCGDLAVPVKHIQDSPSRCSCGRRFVRVQRFEGRVIDCVQLSDGRVLSPYQLTMAMEQVPNVQRYQITQLDFDRFKVGYVMNRHCGDCDATVNQIRHALGQVLGPNAVIEAQSRLTLKPPLGRKFRVVECQLSRKAST